MTWPYCKGKRIAMQGSWTMIVTAGNLGGAGIFFVSLAALMASCPRAVRLRSSWERCPLILVGGSEYQTHGLLHCRHTRILVLAQTLSLSCRSDLALEVGIMSIMKIEKRSFPLSEMCVHGMGFTDSPDTVAYENLASGNVEDLGCSCSGDALEDME
jgi:hypothetical protein